MLAFSAKAGALSGSYCTHVQDVISGSTYSKKTMSANYFCVQDTYVFQPPLQGLDLGLLPLCELLAFGAGGQA